MGAVADYLAISAENGIAQADCIYFLFFTRVHEHPQLLFTLPSVQSEGQSTTVTD
jgi:hypothetical protein